MDDLTGLGQRSDEYPTGQSQDSQSPTSSLLYPTAWRFLVGMARGRVGVLYDVYFILIISVSLNE